MRLDNDIYSGLYPIQGIFLRASQGNPCIKSGKHILTGKLKNELLLFKKFGTYVGRQVRLNPLHPNLKGKSNFLGSNQIYRL